MKLINQSVEFEVKPNHPLLTIERAGRTCYQTEPGKDSKKFVKMLIDRGHESVLEHVSASVRIITNRGVSHELVRHRLAAYSQSSTRYVRNDGCMEFIRPVWLVDGTSAALTFEAACWTSEAHYLYLLENGWRPEQAREVLPNALKTEIVMTANMREWRHIFRLRTSKAAHPQMRALMLDALSLFEREFPVLFEDIDADGGK